MKYLVTASEMKKYDTYTISGLGIPAEVLMERAALKLAEVIEEQDKKRSVLVVSGCGNNGGDGLAVSRILCDRGYKVETVLVGNRDHLSREASMQLRILENYGMSVSSNMPDKEYDIIVDALFGVGLNRDVEGVYRETIDRINRMPGIKIAADIPSGIDADTGRVHGIAVKADLTVTFGFIKRGLKFYPGAEYTGKVICADIGITKRSFCDEAPAMYTLEEPVYTLLPKRRPDGNKGTFGKVLLMAGSDGMAGAAVLCARSAFRAGAGMVKVLTCESNREILQETIPEAMLLTYKETDFGLGECLQSGLAEKINEAVEWADCLVAGPGIGVTLKAEILLGQIIENSQKPMMIDADGLNLLSKSDALRQKLQNSIRETGRSVIFTPHVGELSRLLQVSIEEIKADPAEMAQRAARKYGAVVVSKDARTIVCETGKPLFLNTAGNSGMATAGSGDVLTGIIGAICAGGINAYDSAVLGTYLHACAGDYGAEHVGEAGLMASDLIEGMAALQKGKIEE